MRKYLLMVYGDFNDEDKAKNLATSMSFVVDSDQLKFQFSPSFIIFYFGSEVEKDDMVAFLDGVMLGVTDTYFLIEHDNNVHVSMSEENKKHLFDLKSASEGTEIRMSFDKTTNEHSEIEEEDQISEEVIDSILRQVKKRIKKPTLDQLLEKISQNGINSLSSFEKDELDSYSKN